MYQLTTANNIILCTVLSQAKYHFHASAHPPILIVPWFYKVLHVTTHHIKYFHCDCRSISQFLSIVFELTYIAAIVLMHFRCHQQRILQVMNTVKTWQQGYKLVHFLDQICGRRFYGDSV